MTTPQRRPSSATRATRRSRRPAQRNATFIERNRTRLLWAVGGLGFLLLAGMAFASFTRPTYACSGFFEPTAGPTFVGPTQAPTSGSPAPAVTAPPRGYVQPDMGRGHANPGDTVSWALCPPASGKHYQAPGGPIRAGLYGPNDQAQPPGWVHNLEHGALVLAYNCELAPDICTDDGQQQLEALLARWPDSPICRVPPGELTPVIVRFDDMRYPFAAIVWDVILPMQSIDEPSLLEFYARQGEQFNPESQCNRPSPTPGPTPTPGPATPTPGASASPGASAGASPAASPAISAGPSPS